MTTNPDSKSQTFKKGDRVVIDASLVVNEKQHGGIAWSDEATVHSAKHKDAGYGHGGTARTEFAVGIRFDGFDYGTNDADTNCHTVANDKITLAGPTEAEIEKAMDSIQATFRSAHGH